jgi:DNA-binding response OmpR family regulator
MIHSAITSGTNGPYLILAHADPKFRSRCSEYFRRLGWDVHTLHSGQAARQLAHTLAPSIIILGTVLPDESGWLTCGKLTCENPEAKVILVAPRRSARDQQFAELVGAAALVHETCGFEVLEEEIQLALACLTPG